jgi:hypothetical protein
MMDGSPRPASRCGQNSIPGNKVSATWLLCLLGPLPLRGPETALGEAFAPLWAVGRVLGSNPTGGVGDRSRERVTKGPLFNKVRQWD